MPKNPAAPSPTEQRIAAVRRFNRFYTRRIGVLQERLQGGSFSLTAARVLYELAHAERSTATDLGLSLGLDPGYLSRILAGFKGDGLLVKQVSNTDGRQQLLRLTQTGRKAFARIDAASHDEVGALLRRLPDEGQRHLVAAMRTIERLLEGDKSLRAPYLLRTHRPGDMGWVVYSHGVLYAQEYGWDEQFEALVAEIVTKFVRQLDPRRERCWIAERDGENVGCVFLVKREEEVAQLRLLLVEPGARGLGIGKRLVEECTRFARQAGYRKIVLWTNSVLHAARKIYEAAGYVLIDEEPHTSFGKDLVGQTWELVLGRG
jgi:DNA-binding MarR family transcriptional regulator/N-acetylglutamate synthase-like GNAT family acetyltransferase